MGRLCSPILLGVTTALCSTGAFAADFFVQAMKPGPVTGTPLAIVTLQSTEFGTSGNEEAVESGTFVEKAEVHTPAPGGEVSVQTEVAPVQDEASQEASAETGTPDADSTTATPTNAITQLAVTNGAKWVSARKSKGKGRKVSGPGKRKDGPGRKKKRGGRKKNSEGSNNTGGSNTGGTNTGGSNTGGSNTGGTNTGGSNTGGTNTGGTNTGGTNTGGSNTGGSNTGGNTGGPSTPGGGPTSPTGQTWPSVGALLASGQVQGGDSIYLMDGYHGPITVRGYQFSAPVVIAPLSGHVAHADSITVRSSKNVVVQGLKVWATSANAGTGALIRSYGDTSDLAFTDLDVRGVASSANYMQWSKTDWQTYRRDAFLIDGDSVTVARNRMTGIFHGIKSMASNVLIEENIVDGFGGDGMRANGDNSIVRKNKVQNCFAVSGNHMDGFQSFSVGPNGPGSGTVRDLTIEGNKIFEWTSNVSNPLRCKLQGISMFNGMYDGVTIRNNVISSRAYHGITIYGALNTLVANNTVVHADGVSGNWPWIRNGNKNGVPSQNVIFANNLVNGNKVQTDSSRNVLSVNNIIVSNSGSEFTSVAQQDFSLKSTAKAANAGQAKYAPPTDIVGTPRPLGKAPDAGAYENY